MARKSGSHGAAEPRGQSRAEHEPVNCRISQTQLRGDLQLTSDRVYGPGMRPSNIPFDFKICSTKFALQNSPNVSACFHEQTTVRESRMSLDGDSGVSGGACRYSRLIIKLLQSADQE